MWHMLFDGKPWFRPKTHGIGSGLPIAWQGWVLVLSYLLAIMGLAVLAERVRGYALAGVILLMLLATGILLAVSWARTEGGWRCRWGEDD